MDETRLFGGILPKIASEQIISLETSARWRAAIKASTGNTVRHMDAIIANCDQINEDDWIYAAHVHSRAPYHPIGEPSAWLNPREHSMALLRHYSEYYGIILYTEGRVSHVGMLDCAPESCQKFAEYFEAWRQFRFFCIGPSEFSRTMQF